MACELPADSGVPLSRWSCARARARGGHARDRRADLRGRPSGAGSQRTRSSRGSTAPGSSRATPTSPSKAGRILDLYAGRWQGELPAPRRLRRLRRREALDPSAQRAYARTPPRPAGDGPAGRARVRAQGRALLPRRLGRTTREALRPLRRQGRDRAVRPARRAVHDPAALQHAPGASSWIVDNGSAHRGQRSIDRLQGAWPNLILVHTPIHASWLNQAEIYFSVVQRKVAHPQRLRRPRHPRAAAPRLRPPLRADRRAVRMEVHPRRPRPAPRQDRRPTRRPRRLTPEPIRARTSEPEHLEGTGEREETSRGFCGTATSWPARSTGWCRRRGR